LEQLHSKGKDKEGSTAVTSTRTLRNREEFFRSRREQDKGDDKKDKDGDQQDEEEPIDVESLGGMQIFVSLPTGKTITLDVEATDTIAMTKALIHNKEGIPRSQQRLIFASAELEVDSATLESVGIVENSTVVLLMRLLGSGKRARMVALEEPEEVQNEDYSARDDDIDVIHKLLSVRDISIHALLTSLSLKELKAVNDTVSAERNGDRIVAAIASLIKERRSAERTATMIMTRLELGRKWSIKLAEAAMMTENWLSESGLECKRFKTYIAGLVTVGQQCETLGDRMARMRVG
jgi:hypothetical protein